MTGLGITLLCLAMALFYSTGNMVGDGYWDNVPVFTGIGGTILFFLGLMILL